MVKKVFLGVLMFVFVGIGGCQPSGLSGLVKLDGVVYLDDERIGDAKILFSPEPGQSEPIRAASAISRRNGSFSAMTLKFDDGIYPGKYRISVEKFEVIDTRTPEQKKRDVSSVVESNSDIPPSPPITQKNITPEKYHDFNTSELTVEVGRSGLKNFEIRLSSR